MKKKLDTSWFELKKYDGLKALDLYGWERQISARQGIRAFLGLSHQLAVRWFEDIKVCPIVEEDKGRERWGKWRKSDANHPYNTNSVFNIPAESLKLFSDSLRLRPANYAPQDSLSYHSYREKAELSEATPDLQDKSIDSATFQWNIPPTPPPPELPDDTPTIGGDRGSFLNTTAVMIDLSASDQQIKKDFDHWLSEYRKAMKCAPGKFTEETHLAGWVKNRLLPYIDLRLAAELDGLRLGPAGAAKLIFPGFSGRTADRISRTTKLHADWLMEERSLLAIQAQLRSMTPE